MTMTLRGQQCLVKLAPPKTESAGIVLAESIPPPQTVGRIVDAGPQCRDVATGMVILFDAVHAQDVPGFPTPHVIVAEPHILGELSA
jgi:hypothetical protein